MSFQPRTRLFRAAALGALLALSGCAGGAPPTHAGSLTGIVHPADIPGPACSAAHRVLVDEALATARQRLDAAIRLAETQPDHAHLRRWFGTTPAPEVAGTFRRIATRLEQTDGIKILCNDPPACTGTRMAYAVRGGWLLGLCPGFFRAPDDGFDTRWGTLVHEASHLAAGTVDHAYGPRAALILAKDDPARAAVNADNYEYFIESLPGLPGAPSLPGAAPRAQRPT